MLLVSRNVRHATTLSTIFGMTSAVEGFDSASMGIVLDCREEAGPPVLPCIASARWCWHAETVAIHLLWPLQC